MREIMGKRGKIWVSGFMCVSPGSSVSRISERTGRHSHPQGIGGKPSGAISHRVPQQHFYDPTSKSVIVRQRETQLSFVTIAENGLPFSFSCESRKEPQSGADGGQRRHAGALPTGSNHFLYDDKYREAENPPEVHYASDKEQKHQSPAAA